jgi:hypothetical protein
MPHPSKSASVSISYFIVLIGSKRGSKRGSKKKEVKKGSKKRE